MKNNKIKRALISIPFYISICASIILSILFFIFLRDNLMPPMPMWLFISIILIFLLIIWGIIIGKFNKKSLSKLTIKNVIPEDDNKEIYVILNKNDTLKLNDFITLSYREDFMDNYAATGYVYEIQDKIIKARLIHCHRNYKDKIQEHKPNVIRYINVKLIMHNDFIDFINSLRKISYPSKQN